jgi:hypothetical protein
MNIMKKLEKLSMSKFETISKLKQNAIIGGDSDPVWGTYTLPEVTCTPKGSDAIKAKASYPIDMI